MTALRHLYTRRFIAGLLFAVTLLIPLKAVFACAMMYRVVESCCCDQESYQAPVTSEDAASGDRCCAVMVDQTAALTAAESVAKQPVKKLWDSSPDLATAPPAPVTIAASLSAAQTPSPFEPYTYDGSRLYLLTARLRL